MLDDDDGHGTHHTQRCSAEDEAQHTHDTMSPSRWQYAVTDLDFRDGKETTKARLLRRLRRLLPCLWARDVDFEISGGDREATREADAWQATVPVYEGC